MIDLETVTRNLLHHEDEDVPWRSRSARTLGPGVVRLEYDQDDSVFLVRVERIPVLRPAGGEPVAVGTVDGLTVRLTGVTVEAVQGQLIVRLDIEDSPRRQALEAAYHREFEAWAEHSRDSDEEPPPTPGGRLSEVAIEVTDDRGTAYSSRLAYAGGSGTEWRGGRYFLPAPPAEAQSLTIRLAAGDAQPVDVVVPLA